ESRHQVIESQLAAPTMEQVEEPTEPTAQPQTGTAWQDADQRGHQRDGKMLETMTH
nr:hypothetical protein [Gammaproteobacteria bacterium]NIV51939.1 hypothetical protein [Gammaproteobacteria bacterium]NIX86375.1 hypothetical protein [Gammaproteobacteria bacterium]